MANPQNRPPTLVALAALLLIPLAALWVIFSSTHSHPPPPPGTVITPGSTGQVNEPAKPSAAGTSDTPGTIGSPAIPAAPPPPPPRILAGALAQGDFNLRGVTPLAGNHPLKPPDASISTANGTADGQSNPFLQSAGAGTGLWFQVRGGVGLKTLIVPRDGAQHLYPFGHFTFAVQTLPHSGYSSTQWLGPGGGPLFSETPPYTPWIGGEPPSLATASTLKITLMPSSLAALFQVAAQPLSAAGKPLSRPISLLCQIYDASTVFAQLPASYSAETKQFRVTVVRTGTQRQIASWRITDLPLAVKNGPDALPPTVSTQIGPYTVQASAAETDDTSGMVPPMLQRPLSAPGKIQTNSQNEDEHSWTGIPTLEYQLKAHVAAPLPPNQSWILQMDHVTPQWSQPKEAMRYTTEVSLVKPPDFLPLTNTYAPSLTSGWQQIQQGQVGIAYPGQQHWIKFEGEALRSVSHIETVTFHDAEVIHDPEFGGDRLIWKQSQMITTPSGISMMVLNAHPGRRGLGITIPTNTSFGDPNRWWYDRGNAELILAWRLPPGLTPGSQARPNTPRVADLPGSAGPLGAMVDTQRPPPFAPKINPPDEVDAKALQAAGYSFLRLSVFLPQMPQRVVKPPPSVVLPIPSHTVPDHAPSLKPLPSQPPKPEVLPPYSWREGMTIVTAKPLPRHLQTLTLQITVHEQKETRPFHLVVPIRGYLPPSQPLR